MSTLTRQNLTPEPLREDLADFEERTGLPARGTRKELEAIDPRMRYLTTEAFDNNGQSTRMEQIQYGRKGNSYLWKRMIPAKDLSDRKKFQIHLEINKDEKPYYFPIED